MHPTGNGVTWEVITSSKEILPVDESEKDAVLAAVPGLHETKTIQTHFHLNPKCVAEIVQKDVSLWRVNMDTGRLHSLDDQQEYDDLVALI